MKRILLLLAVLPSLASAQTNYPVADGQWTNAATWSLGTVPTTAHDVILTNYSVTSAGGNYYTVRSLKIESGTLTLATANRGVISSNTFTMTGGAVVSAGGLYYIYCNNGANVTGGLWSNTNLSVSKGNVVFTNTTWVGTLGKITQNAGTSEWRIAVIGGTSLNILAGTKTTLADSVVGLYGGECIVYGSLVLTNSTVDVSYLAECSSGSGDSLELYESSMLFTNSAQYAMFRVNTFDSVTVRNSEIIGVKVRLSANAYSITNSTLRFWMPGGASTFDASFPGGSVIWSQTVAGATAKLLGRALVCDSWKIETNHAPVVSTAGFTVTGGTLTLNGSFIASNSTITATSALTRGSGNYSNMTSTVRLAGGSWGIQKFYNLSSIGAASVTGAVTCTGTIYSEAPSASLNLSGGTLTVSGQSLFGGTISNGTIGASAPVTAERTQGVNGRINSIEQMGAE